MNANVNNMVTPPPIFELKEEFNKPNNQINGIVVDETIIKALNSKQDKVEGKGLSTHDFTTALKEKLEGLTNYDDTELTTKLAQLENSLNTILKDENATAVIDTFQEIEAFLQGITNTETLTGLLQDLKSDILALCAGTYLPLSGGEITGTLKINTIHTIDDDTLIVYKPNNMSSVSNNQWGVGSTCQGVIRSNNSSLIHYTPNNKYTIWDSGNDGPGSGLDADTLDGKHLGLGNDNVTYYVDFPNASGLVNAGYNTEENKYNTQEYLKGLCKWSIDNFANKGVIILQGNASPNSDGWCVIHLYSNDGKGSTGLPKYFSGLYNTLGKAIVKFYSTNSNWLYSEIAHLNSNVASADKLTTKRLTNEDLNSLKDGGVIYNALANNTCTNVPVQNGAFGLQVLYVSGGNVEQIFINNSTGAIYIRHFGGASWSDWQQLATTDGAVAKLTTKELSNEDLNTLKEGGLLYHAYGNNTCANKPTGITNFSLQTYRWASTTDVIQIIADNKVIYKRSFDGVTWTPWKKMLTEDDIASLESRITALENK